MKCERCPKTTQGFDLFDYCATCGRNLCPGCAEEGCCGVKPMASGQTDDETTACAECGRLLGHSRKCSKRPQAKKRGEA